MIPIKTINDKPKSISWLPMALNGINKRGKYTLLISPAWLIMELLHADSEFAKKVQGISAENTKIG